MSGTKEAFDLPLASTNRVRSFRPWRDLGSFSNREPSVETLGYFQQKKEDAKHVHNLGARERGIERAEMNRAAEHHLAEF